MDEFGVLTERYGLKPQRKAAPMASSKRPTASNSFNSSSNNVSFDFPQSNTNQNFGSLDDYADIFGGSKGNTSTSNNGVSFGFDSVFDSGLKTSESSSYGYGGQDDIFGGLTGLNSSSSNKKSDDVFPSFASPPKQSSPIDDLLGGFNNSGNDDDVFGVFSNDHSGTTSNGSVNGSKNKNVGGFDDLIPGFGPSASDYSGASKPQQSAMRSTISNSVLSEDPFVVLESTSERKHTSSDTSSDPLEEFGNFRRANSDVHKEKSPDATSIDELEAFAMGGFKKNANAKATNGKIAKAVSAGDVKVAAGKINVNIKTVPKPSHRTASGSSSNMKKASSATNIADDLSSVFGDASFFGDFEEVEGESEERRRARLGRQGRTQQRVAKAVAEMNQREFQTQQEQEERHRIAETLDAEIKRWAAGKEGNMRALLSSLQQVLWPESGWEPVSISDLITSTSVKKVYRKASLYVHPDKVQQKGANLQQKYIAEKVFDILKEAYMKFSTEELR